MNACAIIHVDDEENDRLIFERALRKAGFTGEYLGFESLQAARAYVLKHREARPRVCVCDGSVGSEEALQEFIRALPAGCVAVGYSGTASPAVHAALLQAGARERMLKSLNFDEVYAAARRVVALCR